LDYIITDERTKGKGRHVAYYRKYRDTATTATGWLICVEGPEQRADLRMITK